jgi:hypothetical protein
LEIFFVEPDFFLIFFVEPDFFLIFFVEPEIWTCEPIHRWLVACQPRFGLVWFFFEYVFQLAFYEFVQLKQ